MQANLKTGESKEIYDDSLKYSALYLFILKEKPDKTSNILSGKKNITQ